jgi:hypothetical protein
MADTQTRPARPVSDDEHVDRGVGHVVEWSLIGFLAVLCAGIFMPAGWPVVVPASGGFVGGLVCVTAVWYQTGSGPKAAVTAGWFTYGAGWLAATRYTGVWHVAPMLGLLLPAVVLTGGGVLASTHHDRVQSAARRSRVAAGGGPDEDSDKNLRIWRELLARNGAPDCKVLVVGLVRTGHAVRFRLPGSAPGKPAYTSARLTEVADSIEVDLGLPAGAVRFEENTEDRAEITMFVNDRKARTMGTVFLPVRNDEQSVRRPWDLGVIEATGKVFAELFRQVHALIVGLTGSGKSNLLNVMIAQSSRCVDTINLMIDAKGGQTARPWIEPWLNGECAEPCILWVATTRDEARRMLDAVHRGLQARAAGVKGEVIPSRDMPQINLFCDELVFIIGHGKTDIETVGGEKIEVSNLKMAQRLLDIVETGRSSAGMLIGGAVHADSDALGGTGIKRQIRLRFGMATATMADAQSLFPDHPKAAKMLTMIRQPGAGILLKLIGGAHITGPVDFYRVTGGQEDDATGEQTEDMITPIAIECGDRIRPQLDQLTRDAFGPDFESRWERPHGQTLLATWKGETSTVAGGDEFDEIIAALDDGKTIPAWQELAITLLREAGAAGYTPRALLDKLEDRGKGVARETLNKWLTQQAVTGPLARVQDGQSLKSVRYVWKRKTS